jgi:hypothetical protein
LPSTRSDKTRLGLVHRNVEQTLAVLEVPEVHISATAVEYLREMDSVDDHAESVVSAAVSQSLRDSGLLAGPELADQVKQAAILCGHGVLYAAWRVHTQEVDYGELPIMAEGPDGGLDPVRDDEGLPTTQATKVTKVIRESPGNWIVSPLEFLFDPLADSIALSPWHAWERVIRLDDLEDDGRFTLPPGLEEGVHTRRDLYGDEPGTDEAVEKGVKVILAYDKAERELCVFLEPGQCKGDKAAQTKQPAMHCLLAEPLPVTFDSPDDSPFVAFVPIPALDDPYGISQVAHIRNPAVQADVLSSRIDTQTLGQKRIFAFDSSSGLDEEQIRKAMAAPDFGVVKIANAMGADLQKALVELPMQHPTAEAFQGIERGKADVSATSGVSDIPYGGANTATESQNMMTVGGARVQRKRRLFLDFLTNVARVHLALLAEFSPEGQAAVVPELMGQSKVLPYGRDAFTVARFNLRAIAGGAGAAKTPVQAKAILDGLGMMAPFAGPALKVWMAEQLAQTLGLEDMGRMRRALYADAQMLSGPPAPGPAGVDGNLRADPAALDNMLPGQVVRAGINPLNESASRR